MSSCCAVWPEYLQRRTGGRWGVRRAGGARLQPGLPSAIAPVNAPLLSFVARLREGHSVDRALAKVDGFHGLARGSGVHSKRMTPRHARQRASLPRHKIELAACLIPRGLGFPRAPLKHLKTCPQDCRPQSCPGMPRSILLLHPGPWMATCGQSPRKPVENPYTTERLLYCITKCGEKLASAGGTLLGWALACPVSAVPATARVGGRCRPLNATTAASPSSYKRTLSAAPTFPDRVPACSAVRSVRAQPAGRGGGGCPEQRAASMAETEQDRESSK